MEFYFSDLATECKNCWNPDWGKKQGPFCNLQHTLSRSATPTPRAVVPLLVFQAQWRHRATPLTSRRCDVNNKPKTSSITKENTSHLSGWKDGISMLFQACLRCSFADFLPAPARLSGAACANVRIKLDPVVTLPRIDFALLRQNLSGCFLFPCNLRCFSAKRMSVWQIWCIVLMQCFTVVIFCNFFPEIINLFFHSGKN